MKGVILQIETGNQIGLPLSVISVLTVAYRADSILTLLAPVYQYLVIALSHDTCGVYDAFYKCFVNSHEIIGTDKHPFRCAGNGSIYIVSGHNRSVSLAGSIRILQLSMMVNGLSVPTTD